MKRTEQGYKLALNSAHNGGGFRSRAGTWSGVESGIEEIPFPLQNWVGSPTSRGIRVGESAPGFSRNARFCASVTIRRHKEGGGLGEDGNSAQLPGLRSLNIRRLIASLRDIGASDRFGLLRWETLDSCFLNFTAFRIVE